MNGKGKIPLCRVRVEAATAATSIIGMPAHWEHVTGSKLFSCGQCGVSVWLSPNSQRAVAAVGAKVLCVKCAPPDVMAEFEAGDFGVLEGAIEEYLCWRDRN
jgi:ribosomal protein S27AE